MSGAQERLQAAVSASLDKLDRAYIRKLTKKAYQCMASCQDQSSFDANQVHQCESACQVPLHEVQQIMSHELNYFQDRLQRCSAACQDQARDSLQKATGGAQPNAAQQAALTKQVEACVGKCADTHIPLMKDVEAKLFAECKKRL